MFLVDEIQMVYLMKLRTLDVSIAVCNKFAPSRPTVERCID